MQDLATIKAFHALCQHRSLTAAAQALNQPKSTFSRRISQLEAELGQTLIARQGNRLQPTAAGKIFFEFSERMLALATQSKEALQAFNENIHGRLNIAVHASLVRGWMSQVLDDFLNCYPDIHIRLHDQYLPNMENQVDLMIWVGKPPQNAFRREVLGYWQYGLYASPEYLEFAGTPEHPHDLLKHQWVNLNMADDNGISLTNGSQVVTLPAAASRLISDSVVLQTDTIVKGHGIGLLPTWFVHRYNLSHPGNLVPCLPQWRAEPACIACYYPSGRPPAKLQALLEKLRAHRPAQWQTST